MTGHIQQRARPSYEYRQLKRSATLTERLLLTLLLATSLIMLWTSRTDNQLNQPETQPAALTRMIHEAP